MKLLYFVWIIDHVKWLLFSRKGGAKAGKKACFRVMLKYFEKRLFVLILDQFYDGRFTNVDNFDKSLLFSISFPMEGSLIKLSLQIFTLKFSLIHLRIVKAGDIVFLLTVLHASCFSKWQIKFQ